MFEVFSLPVWLFMSVIAGVSVISGVIGYAIGRERCGN